MSDFRYSEVLRHKTLSEHTDILFFLNMSDLMQVAWDGCSTCELIILFVYSPTVAHGGRLCLR
jgi:hypothetical protein